jgi:hypothetical protein
LFVSVNVSKVPRVTRALLIEPSFQLESICFVLGDVQKGLRLKKVKHFSFYNCKYCYEDRFVFCLTPVMWPVDTEKFDIVVTLWVYIQKVLASNLSLDTTYHD